MPRDDVSIVGAGAAGSGLASRSSDDRARQVLLPGAGHASLPDHDPDVLADADPCGGDPEHDRAFLTYPTESRHPSRGARLTLQLIFCDGKEDESAYPKDVFGLREDVRAAQGIILVTPAYHSGYSGVLKNALDLMGFDEFEGKMLGLVGVSGRYTW